MHVFIYYKDCMFLFIDKYINHTSKSWLLFILFGFFMQYVHIGHAQNIEILPEISVASMCANDGQLLLYLASLPSCHGGSQLFQALHNNTQMFHIFCFIPICYSLTVFIETILFFVLSLHCREQVIVSTTCTPFV